MKKLTRTTKLNLKTETVLTLLTPGQLGRVAGGAMTSDGAGGCVGKTQTCTCIDTVYC